MTNGKDAGLKVRTGVKWGGIFQNHNRTVMGLLKP